MYSEIASNKRKTWVIMSVFLLLVGALGWFVSFYFLGDPSFTVMVIIGALVYAIVSYFGAASAAIAMHGAREVDQASEPRLYKTVENLSIATGMPMPKVYVIEDRAMNAFATGRDPNHAVVAATRGLLDVLDNSELEGVMAHELGHVRNYDIRVSMIAMALALAISLIADMAMRGMIFGGGRRDDNENNSGNGIILVVGFIGLILAPIIARLIQLAISRKREYLADATGAETTRYPEALASALIKISHQGSGLRTQSTATAHLFFASPFRSGGASNWFSTHPPVDQRVKRLREMGTRL